MGTNFFACLPIFEVVRSATKRAINEELWRENGYSLSLRYFPIHSNEKTNKRLNKTRINEHFGQYSLLSLVRHFVCK